METARKNETIIAVSASSSAGLFSADKMLEKTVSAVEMDCEETQREQYKFIRACRRQLLIVDEDWW